MPKYTKSLISWSILGIAGLLIFIFFFNQASPIASIDTRLSKEEIFRIAAGYIEAQGFDLKGYDKAIIFYSDYDASAYLQKTQGIEKSNELIREGIPVWFWRVRWFKELQKEGFVVDVDPSTGEIVRFYYSLLDDAKGENLPEAQARAMAEEQLASQGIDLKAYALKDSTTKRQKQRTDYYFDWEKKDYKIEDATLRVKVDILGDKLGRYKRYLKVPEGFSRYIERETSLGEVLYMISNIFMFLLTIAVIVVLIVHSGKFKFDWRWKFGLIFSCIVLVSEISGLLNHMPLLWNLYPDTISKPVFIMMSLERGLIAAFSIGLMVFAYGCAGDLLSRDLWQTKMPLLSPAGSRYASLSGAVPTVIVGYSLAFIFLGYITLFYIIGAKFFDIWMPPNTEYSNILGTSIPMLFPLTIALSAAIKEEFMYRLFAISFLKRYLKLTWLAVFIPALIWGFAHSNYPVFPNYVRGIELTVFGIALGITFLKYGLEAVVITHFIVNASLAGLPLLKSHNPYFIISGAVVIFLALIPVLIPVIKLRIEAKKGIRMC